jgi:hypothetical protein
MNHANLDYLKKSMTYGETSWSQGTKDVRLLESGAQFWCVSQSRRYGWAISPELPAQRHQRDKGTIRVN